MTEVEWILSDDAKEMYSCLRNQHGATRRKAGKRKLRLFGCASCRLFGSALSDPRSLAAVEYMERFADGEANPDEMAGVKEAARQALSAVDRQPVLAGFGWLGTPERQATEAVFTLLDDRADGCPYAHWAMRSSISAGDATLHQDWLDQLRKLAHLLRDIFGNPFRPVTFARSWFTSDVVALARGIYDERAFDRMPILADALQDAGCNNEDVLDHCRDANQLHARGCWVVDMLLAKARLK